MNVGVAILGGIIGGTAMIAVLYMMIWLMPKEMKMNLLLMLGTMIVPAGAMAYLVGLMMHAMMSVLFGVAHGALLASVDVDSAAPGLGLGVLFGFGHAFVTGAMLGVMPLMHPRMRPLQPKLVPAMLGPAPVSEEEALGPPGFFALNYPPLTVMGFFMMHIMFGITVGVVYGAFA